MNDEASNLISGVAASVREHATSVGGSSLTWFAVVASLQNVEAGLRITSLVFAILVSCATLWNIFRRPKR